MPDVHDSQLSDPVSDRLEERGKLVAFVHDAASEATLIDGLADAGCGRPLVVRGGVKTAVASLGKNDSPRVLIVDVGGEADPMRALDALAAVAEPSTAVLVIGDIQDMDFYREITRGAGVAEYLAKPLVRDRVARLFGPVVRGQAFDAAPVNGGRSISITGTSGGVGATTLAVNLAWHLAAQHRRHTCLLDADLFLGGAALMLDQAYGPGLHSALEAPERIDLVFLDRAAELVDQDAVDGRLSLLASEASMLDDLDYLPGAAATLLDVMRQRYSVVVVDAPFVAGPFARDLLNIVTQRVFVLDPTLASVRGAMRLSELGNGPGQSRRPILVLNRLGRVGGLSRKLVEQTLGRPVDVVIAELPGKALDAANLGKPLVTQNAPFRAGIDALVRQLSLSLGDSVGPRVRRRRSDRSSFGRLFNR